MKVRITAKVDSSDGTVSLEGRSRFSIYYEDTDFSGYVYHANYLKFFERAREDLIGLELLKTAYQEGLHFVVKSAAVDFLAAARHGDEVVVATTLLVSTSPLVRVTQAIFTTRGDPTGEEIPLVRGILELVAVGKAGRPRRIPASFLAALGARGRQDEWQ